MSFAKQLKSWMKAKGISQKQLAEMIGRGKPSVSQYLSGKNIPRKDVQAKIAEALNCSVDDLHKPIIKEHGYTYSEAKMVVMKRELQEYIRVLPDDALRALKPLIMLMIGETSIDETDLSQEDKLIVIRGQKEYEKKRK